MSIENSRSKNYLFIVNNLGELAFYSSHALLFMQLNNKQKLWNGNLCHQEAPNISATPMDLLRHPNIRKKFFILAFDWVANAVVYNGLSYNATNLGVSDYLAFFIGK